jgi:predicted branched-subunit amino acid permease
MRRAHLTRLIVPELDRAGYREGIRDMAPLGVAIAVWGLVTGVAMVNGGLPVAIALVMTLVVFAGSAQLAVLPLLLVGAPLPIVWVTATLVNLRFAIFAAASRRSFAALTAPQRLFAGYLHGDIGFALFSRRFADDPQLGNPFQWGYFFGGALVNWMSWQLASIAGILLGGLAPTTWGLELAAVLALAAVLIPMLIKLPVVAGVVVTGVVSVVTVGIPYRLGLIVSVIAGVTVAVSAESFTSHRLQQRRGPLVDGIDQRQVQR